MNSTKLTRANELFVKIESLRKTIELINKRKEVATKCNANDLIIDNNIRFMYNEKGNHKNVHFKLIMDRELVMKQLARVLYKSENLLRRYELEFKNL